MAYVTETARLPLKYVEIASKIGKYAYREYMDAD